MRLDTIFRVAYFIVFPCADVFRKFAIRECWNRSSFWVCFWKLVFCDIPTVWNFKWWNSSARGWSWNNEKLSQVLVLASWREINCKCVLFVTPDSSWLYRCCEKAGPHLLELKLPPLTHLAVISFFTSWLVVQNRGTLRRLDASILRESDGNCYSNFMLNCF